MLRNVSCKLFTAHVQFETKLNTVRLSQAAWSTAKKSIEDNLKTIQDEGTWKKERIITTKQGAHIQVDNKQRNIINFCANNYLGLSVSDPIVNLY